MAARLWHYVNGSEIAVVVDDGPHLARGRIHTISAKHRGGIEDSPIGRNEVGVGHIIASRREPAPVLPATASSQPSTESNQPKALSLSSRPGATVSESAKVFPSIPSRRDVAQCFRFRGRERHFHGQPRRVRRATKNGRGRIDAGESLHTWFALAKLSRIGKAFAINRRTSRDSESAADVAQHHARADLQCGVAVNHHAACAQGKVVPNDRECPRLRLSFHCSYCCR